MLLHRLPVAFEADHELVVLSALMVSRQETRPKQSLALNIIFSNLPTYRIRKLEITTSYSTYCPCVVSW
jgi:hypothetical protein